MANTAWDFQTLDCPYRRQRHKYRGIRKLRITLGKEMLTKFYAKHFHSIRINLIINDYVYYANCEFNVYSNKDTYETESVRHQNKDFVSSELMIAILLVLTHQIPKSKDLGESLPANFIQFRNQI